MKAMDARNERWKGALWTLVVVALLLVGGWLVYRANNRTQTVNEQEATTTTPEATAPSEDERAGTVEYTSTKGVVLRLDRKLEDTLLTSPLTITGSVPGNWSFEADFPVELQDSTGRMLAQQPATLQGDWMTTEYVPFTVTLDYVEPEERQTAKLILHKSNPSGLDENDDRVEIDVLLSARR